MHITVGTIVSLVIGVALAAPGFPRLEPNCLTHKSAFKPSPDGLAALNLPVALMAAAPKLELVDANGKTLESCTGAVVSDSGAVLTAGHCVDRCLATQGVYATDQGHSVLQRAKLPAATCSFRINGADAIEGKVLATSECRQREKLDVKSSCSGLDYALIKLDSKTAAPCLRAARTPPAVGVNLASIAFPRETFRGQLKKGAGDSNGKDQQVSVGPVIKPTPSCRKVVDDPGLVARMKGHEAPGVVNFPKNFRTDFYMDRARAGHLFQSETDFEAGSSGGMGVDLSTGELAGLATVNIVSNQFVECSGGTFFTSVPEIIKDLRTNYPALDLGRELGCERRALFPASK